MSKFLQFAETAEKVGATTKRLEKAAFLREYFENLTDDDLQLAARFCAGHAFSLSDQRTTNIGGAALFKAVSAVTNIEVEELKRLTVKSGDIGDTAEKIFQTNQAAEYTLQNIADFISNIAATNGTKAKTALLIDFLKPANNLEAKYMIKILTGDLRIGLLEGAVEDALARMFDQPVSKVQWTNMLTGDIGETALLLRQGKTDTAKMRFFHPIKFMLASASDLDDVAKRMPDQFVVEDKFDGIRAQAHIALANENNAHLHGVNAENARVGLFSRTLDEITNSFPELIEPLSKLIANQPDGLILDGEILPIRDGKILPFQDLQKRLGRKTVSAEMLVQTPVAFVAYDCLFGNGKILINEAFEARRRILDSLRFDGKQTILTESKIFSEVAAIDDEFDAARMRGNEGLMIKNPSASYKPGKRGRDWLKIKRALATLDVVVTSVEVGNGKRSRFLSDYTFAVRASEIDATLLNVGKAYSGLTDVEIEELSNWFRAHTLQEFAHGKVRVVEPQIILEVTFDRVQPSARHKSGYALRFPRILRIRNDKPLSEIDTLETVKRLSE
ncbi:MAG: ATP-dependent DNA ligase [Pyrinomonadaceae bacterium]